MKIEHIAVWVQDLSKMKSFYETYFNARASELYHNPKKNFTSHFLSYDSGSRLEFMHMPGINEVEDPLKQYFGFTHLAFSVGSRERVDALTERLRKDGYAIVGEPRVTGDGYYESVILDPENNRIEITE